MARTTISAHNAETQQGWAVVIHGATGVGVFTDVTHDGFGSEQEARDYIAHGRRLGNIDGATIISDSGQQIAG